MNAAIQSADDFLRGQIDCQQGQTPPVDASPDYLRGFSLEYEREQIMTEISRRGYGAY